MSAQVPLRELVARAPLVVCLGPGGVGKTTVSAVLALHCAASKRRSLVLTIDPARRLADALSLPGLTNDPVEVKSFKKMHPGGSLSALMLDPTATFDHLIAMLVPDEARRQALLDNRFYQHMSRSLAGTLEYMAVERLYTLTSSGNYDAVVLDTPPTTNALDFIEAPDRLRVFFSDKVTRWFLPAEGSRSLAARVLDRAGSRVLGLIEKVAGEDFVQETMGFFGAFRDLLGDFQHRGERVGAVLRHPDTVFLVVASPDPYRLAEAVTVDQRLAEAGVTAAGFIINRVDAPFLPGGEVGDQIIQRATGLLGGKTEQSRVETFIQRLEALRRARDSAASRHAEAVAQLRRHARGRPVFVAPGVPPSESPRASLLAIYVGLFADGAAG